ncbi:PAS-domain containing protein [Pikeienuella sp. HZG-20]|uniref:sensor histidine kinase n=1 Tax=Paludibacillus litoralis TaxID=3133267 RepID=UPI0030ED56CE
MRAAASGRPGAAARDEGFAAASAAAVLRFNHDGLIEATEDARALLGLRKSGALSSDAVLGQLESGRAALEAALGRLLADGEAFQVVIGTRDGKVLDVAGAPYGIDATIVLHDQTALWRRAEAAEGRLDAVERELADYRQARRAVRGIIWRDGDAGYDGGLDGRVRTALTAAAKSISAPGEPRRVTLKTDEGREIAYDLLRTEDGLFIARDMGRALATERAMSRLVDTISETFAHLKVGLMIFDADRRLSLFNPVAVALCDESPEWLAQRPSLREVLDRMRRARALPEQVDYAGWRANLLKRVSNGAAEPFDVRWHLPDGRALKAIFRPHAAGGLAVVIEDVTESLALRRVNAVERAARDATTDMLEEGIVVFGPDGRFRMANGAFRGFWGIADSDPTPGDHVDKVIAICRMRTGPLPFWDELKAAASGGADRRVTVDAFALTDGRSLSGRVSPMPDGATLAVFTDVTASVQVAAALKERNDALEQAEEMRSAMVDQISHQMRTPLNSIFGFGQLLDDGRVGPLNPVQTDYVRGIVASSGELLEAIDGMADLISTGADAPREARVAFDPAAALREVAALVERRADRRGDIEIDAAAAPPRIFGHRVRFRQIIFNMAADAFSRTERGGRVGFAIRSEGRDLVLECGYPADEDPSEAGQGMALALVRRFVRLNGGEVTISRDDAGRRVVHCRIAGGAGDATAPLAWRASSG